MANKRFSEITQAPSSQMTDIICAIQGYIGPSELGISYKETLQQVYDLFQSNVILYNSGNPNNNLAGKTYQLCWDTLNHILWVCTVTGTEFTAEWKKSIELIAGVGIDITQNGNNIEISASNILEEFIDVSGTTQQMDVDTTYQPMNASLTVLTLPVTASVGKIARVTGFGIGGWRIEQNLGQKIIIGNLESTSGTGGSLSSTLRYDGVELVCTEESLTWKAIVSPVGMLNIV